MTGTRVYVGRIPFDARERDIEKFFKGYGRIREILLKDGFAFVEFDDHRDAEDAVYELNGKEMLGERVHVEFARGQIRGRGGRFSGRTHYGGGSRYSSRNGSGFSESRYGPPRNTEYRVIVENLSSRVSWQDLKDFMRTAGEVTYADAHKREKNMGIVDFATYSDMKNAIDKLNGEDLQGRKIRLHEDKSRRRRSRSRSRSRSPRRRSRSRSPRRSRSRSKSDSDRSKSRSKSPANRRSSGGDDRNRSKSRDSRRSDSSRSRSKSPDRTNGSGAGGDKNGSVSRSRSRSVSGDRGRDNHSRSPSRDDSRSRSGSPDGKDQSDNNSIYD